MTLFVRDTMSSPNVRLNKNIFGRAVNPPRFLVIALMI